MYDFSVFYSDFKQNLTIDKFCEELETLGGYPQSYDVNMLLDGVLISQNEFNNLDLDNMCKVKYVPVNADEIEVLFYNYSGEAREFFNKYGVEHDKKFVHQVRVQKEFRVCMSNFI